MRSLLFGLLLASGAVAAQDVYKCVDDQGRTTYTQSACPAASQVTTIPLQSLPDSNGFTPPPRQAVAPAPTAPQQITVVPAPAPSRQRPVDDITIVGGSSSSRSSQQTEVRGPGVIYQPYPVYIDRRPRNETWHMVPHPQAPRPPAPPPSPPLPNGIPIDR
ncbi:DUF4124 domain-containing protein [Pseudomonas sp. EpS/L25]|uniref:DUF4124 domain-containing protein n=1 Tax=Pseudomonas sp. EpS/L25 TaxID=1749078 RepID=UPI0007439F17|nr:DUF4124 domain-containing protein [Pseudomonas sp. EpS/L25]KUM44485.1 hypothetical protein AR540_22350 [Pseudomonas sp. EpS/L25]